MGVAAGRATATFSAGWAGEAWTTGFFINGDFGLLRKDLTDEAAVVLVRTRDNPGLDREDLVCKARLAVDAGLADNFLATFVAVLTDDFLAGLPAGLLAFVVFDVVRNEWAAEALGESFFAGDAALLETRFTGVAFFATGAFLAMVYSC